MVRVELVTSYSRGRHPQDGFLLAASGPPSNGEVVLGATLRVRIGGRCVDDDDLVHVNSRA